MINLTTIIVTLLGVILSAVITFLALKSKNSTIQAKLENANRQLEDTKKQAEIDLQKAQDNYEQRLSDMKNSEKEHYESALKAKDDANNVAINTLKDNYERRLSDQQTQFDHTIEGLPTQFKAITEKVLNERQQNFDDTSIKTMKEIIERMEKAITNSTNTNIEINSSMKAQLEEMNKLSHALAHKSKVQGDWGEAVLTELLTRQGLTKGIHYDIQATIRDNKNQIVHNEEENSLRPDVILHLDKVREVIIDSKVSLTAWLDYVNETDEEKRQQHLKNHIKSLNKHVDELSKKNYSEYIKPPKAKMDYVIMFVPHISALLTALNEQPDLWRKAMEKNVFIADERTLYATLKIIEMTWTQIKQAENHEKIFSLANDIIHRVGLFVKRYNDLGKAMDNAQKAYYDAETTLNSPRQGVVTSVRKMIDLGAKQSNTHPLPEMIDVKDVECLEEVKSLDMPKEDNEENL